MHVDKDDIPEYLRRKTRSPWRMVAILGVGSAITWTLLMIFAEPIAIDVARLKNAVRIGGEPIFEEPQQIVMQQPQGQIYRQSESESRWEQTDPTQEEIAPERQTAFNDRNYAPKGAANVVKFKEVPVQKELEPARKASMVTIVGDSNAKADRCWIHREGSIEKRECKQQMDLYLRNKN